MSARLKEKRRQQLAKTQQRRSLLFGTTLAHRALRDRNLFLLLLAVLLLSLGVAACESTSGEIETPRQVDGPALIMFYTDN